MDSEAIFQTIEANLASSTQRVSGELSISQFSEVCHLHNLCKRISRAAELCHMLYNFWLTWMIANIFRRKFLKVKYWS